MHFTGRITFTVLIFLPLFNPPTAQERVITDKVTNKSIGESFSGVNVFINGPTRGITTNLDGFPSVSAWYHRNFNSNDLPNQLL
jgi:hypothetical protein